MSFVIVFTVPPLQLTLLPLAVNCFCYSHLLLLHTFFCTHEICIHITTIYVLRVHSSVECSRACGMRCPKMLATIFITFREGRFLIVSLPFKRFLWFLQIKESTVKVVLEKLPLRWETAGCGARIVRIGLPVGWPDDRTHTPSYIHRHDGIALYGGR